MKLYFQYNSKSRGQNVPKADVIADETGYEMENNFKILEFDAPRDPALLKLYHLVGNLKGTTIFIEEQGEREILEATKLFRTLACEDRHLCKGLCEHISLGKLTLNTFFDFYGHRIHDDNVVQFDDTLLKSFAPFLTKTPNSQITTYSVNKDAILEDIKERYVSELRFCDKFDKNLLMKKISELPSFIQVVPLEKLEQNYSKRYIPEELRHLKQIFDNTVLNPEMSALDCLGAIRGMNILRRQALPIKGSECWVSLSTGNSEGRAVFWKIMPKKFSGDDEMEAILSKQDGMYVLECPIAVVIFMVTREDSDDIEEVLSKLQEFTL